jgi:hypothetical protein
LDRRHQRGRSACFGQSPVAELDKSESAPFKEDEIRSKVKFAKKRYEDALREKFFGF